MPTSTWRSLGVALNDIYTFYHSSGCIVVGRNGGSNLTILRSSNVQTTAFSTIGSTSSGDVSKLAGAVVVGNKLHVLWINTVVGMGGGNTHYHRVFDLSSDTWDAAATSVVAASSSQSGSGSMATFNRMMGAFSNGEVVALMQESDGSNMGNAIFLFRWWTWTSGGGWVDRGSAFAGRSGSDWPQTKGVLVGDDIANVIQSDTVGARLSQIRLSDHSIDAPPATGEEYISLSVDYQNWAGCVVPGTPDLMVHLKEAGSLTAYEDDQAWGITAGAPTATSLGVSSNTIGGVIADSSGYVHAFYRNLTDGKLYLRRSTNVGDTTAWDTAVEVTAPTSPSCNNTNPSTPTYRVDGSTEWAAFQVASGSTQGVLEVAIVESSGKTQITGAAVGTAVGSATPDLPKAVTGAGIGTAVGTAAALLRKPITGSGIGTAVGVATVALKVAIAGAGIGTAVGAADYTLAAPLASDAVGTAVGAAAFDLPQAIAGDAVGTAVGVATVSIVAKTQITGDAIGTVLGAADYDLVRAIASDAVGTAVGQATFDLAFALASDAVGTAVGDAQATAFRALLGDAVGTALGDAGVDLALAITGASVGTAEGLAAFDLALAVSGDAVGTAVGVATPEGFTLQITGAGVGTAVGAGAYDLPLAVASDAVGTAVGSADFDLVRAVSGDAIGTGVGSATPDLPLAITGAGIGTAVGVATPTAQATQITGDAVGTAVGAASPLLALAVAGDAVGGTNGYALRRVYGRILRRYVGV